MEIPKNHMTPQVIKHYRHVCRREYDSVPHNLTFPFTQNMTLSLNLLFPLTLNMVRSLTIFSCTLVCGSSLALCSSSFQSRDDIIPRDISSDVLWKLIVSKKYSIWHGFQHLEMKQRGIKNSVQVGMSGKNR